MIVFMQTCFILIKTFHSHCLQYGTFNYKVKGFVSECSIMLIVNHNEFDSSHQKSGSVCVCHGSVLLSMDVLSAAGSFETLSVHKIYDHRLLL